MAAARGSSDHRLHERAVQLELVDRQLSQVGQRASSRCRSRRRRRGSRGRAARVRISRARSRSPMRKSSVISSSRISDGQAAARTGSPRRGRGSSSVDQRGRRQVDGDAEHRARRRASCATWSSDCSRTAVVRSRIRPESSTSGRNASGSSRPRVGCCQRTSASTPRTRERARVDLGLVVHDERPAEDRRRAAPRACAAGPGRAASRWPACRRSGRPGVSFAWYIAMSARRSSVDTSRPCAGKQRDADAGVDPHGDAVDGERRRRARRGCRCATVSAPSRVDVRAGRPRTRRRPAGPARRSSPCRQPAQPVGDQAAAGRRRRGARGCR